MAEVKDLIIIGAGPAGITAAVYAARKKMDFTVISRDIGGQAAWSGDIENYTGYQFISGPDLAIKFKEHMEKYEFDLKEGGEVLKVEQEGKNFKVKTSKDEELVAKTLVIASGKRSRLLNIPGEVKFKNRGVTYCATCDGPIFQGKTVAVIGGGNSALDAVLQMIKIAEKVYLININEALGGDAVMIEKVMSSDKAEVLNKTKMLEIMGDKFVKGIRVDQAGKIREIPLQGIFVEIGLLPNSNIIDFVKKNKNDEIMINCSAETSVPGVFAAGDVTDVPEKQIIVAAGDGAKATLAAFKYLVKL
ncbi:MAG: FAD-dependent oxidoreductase [Candidatus Margulisbacteria bacterium]|nr:FAD-dependent oxidoreductase [Candidatus Margulisiibacteriota bacterium]MBU1022369.1 FAD-dependent oxidoreductase [Candidatus Margulisiibacteriota bacterium]MBU1729079.1 FAD-dependent oxidoreductase [Candidatus Margulisiibacteriota bacterium]MBU1954500.1 FAD-dependent oxidoreductase [Candidatus Margulisiibacteriota bacterium]